MKGLWMKLIEWFSHLSFVENISEDPFCRGLGAGFITGLIVAVLFWLIIRLIFRKNADLIQVQSESGTISVSVNAIASVIRHAAEKTLRCLDIHKVSIRKKSGNYQVVIHAQMDAAKEPAPKLMEKLTVIVREQMNAAFGISNISGVKLVISSCRGNADIPVHGNEPDEKSVSATDNDSLILLKDTPKNDL